jgi:hypothetical protein
MAQWARSVMVSMVLALCFPLIIPTVSVRGRREEIPTNHSTQSTISDEHGPSQETSQLVQW